MSYQFQLHDNIDGSQTLWYPVNGVLRKVVRYAEPPTDEQVKRDGRIFLNGLRVR